MPVIEQVPAIIRVFIVFILVLICIRKKLSMGNAFFLGAISLALLFGLGFTTMFRSAVASVFDPKTLSLAVIVSLILILSSSMEEGGQMKRLLFNFKGLVSSSRLNLAIFPALIGLLPMPGGAVFSAPMVKELGHSTSFGPDRLSYINYWYRHIWEYWWPLYPGVLLTTTLANINIWAFVAMMCPLTIVAIICGYLPIKKGHHTSHQYNTDRRPPLKPFLRELSPILIVIGVGMPLGILLSYAFPTCTISKEIGLCFALTLGIFWTWHLNRLDRLLIRKIMTDPHLLSMIYLVLSILVFKGMMEDSHAVTAISRELGHLHVPLILVTVILPFLVGGVVGITIAFVGSTIPILILLISTFGETPFMLAYIMLAMTSGFIGVLLSPLHLCLLLSNQYFGTTLTAVYRHLWLPCLCLLISGIIYFGILRWIAS
jgi:integral membrane protein (TIGR00529 family)